MLNIRKKRIVLIRDVIWPKETYEEYVPRKENTKSDSYILKDEDRTYNWAHTKIDPINNEVNTENVKNEENVKTDQDYVGEEYVQKNIKSVYFKNNKIN